MATKETRRQILHDLTRAVASLTLISVDPLSSQTELAIQEPDLAFDGTTVA